MMNLTIAVFAIVTSALYQQRIERYQSFAVHNKEVFWVQVYHHEDSVKELTERVVTHLKRKMWIRDLHVDGNDIVGELVNYRPDYKRYGGKFMNTSTVIRTGKWDGKVRISFKDGKYRVLLEGLHFQAQQASTASGKATLEKHDISGVLSQWALNDLRTSFKRNRLVNLDILHLSFKDSFALVTDQLIDSDW